MVVGLEVTLLLGKAVMTEARSGGVMVTVAAVDGMAYWCDVSSYENLVPWLCIEPWIIWYPRTGFGRIDSKSS